MSKQARLSIVGLLCALLCCFWGRRAEGKRLAESVTRLREFKEMRGGGGDGGGHEQWMGER